MLRSLNTGVSGLENLQSRLDVIGNNIANASTTGYKSARLDFEEAFSQTLGAASGDAGAGQIGSGVAAGAVRTSQRQGTMASTESATDMAIDGAGFFVVRDPVSGAEFATRAGDFVRDRNGYLVTRQGFRVQGFSDAGLSARGDIRIDQGTETVGMSNFRIAEDGKITVQLEDSRQITRGQVLLLQVTTPEALVREGANLFSIPESAGAVTTLQVAGTAGLGRVRSSQLELSNVDLTREFADLISTQRGFQASARLITTSDEVLQEVINLKR